MRGVREFPKAVLPVQLRPIRAVIRWQLVVTAILALVGGLLAGVHGAVSAALGGLVSVCAGLGFAAVVGLHRGHSAAEALLTALRAEAVKIALLVLLLWLVLTTYRDVVVLGFIGSFAVTAVIFGMAFFVRDK